MHRSPWIMFAAITAACGGGKQDLPVVDGSAQTGSDGSEVSADARPSSECWPAADAPLKGSIELGTGEGGFEPMPDEVRLVYGPQGGFHIVGHARITGLTPGNLVDPADPSNPTTRFRAIFVDTGESTNPDVSATSCGLRLGYQTSGSTATFPSFVEIRYDVALAPSQIFDRDVRVIVEIIDSTGGYARDEKIVTPHEPENWADAGP